MAVRSVPLQRLVGLLCHSDGRVFPQLRAVAAYAASFIPSFFDYLIGADSDVLLDGDVEDTDDARRERLTEALLQELRGKRLRAHELLRRCRGLHHPRLHTQLLAVITNQHEPESARLGAIFMTEGCVSGVPPQLDAPVEAALANLALEENENMRLRSYAAMTIRVRGSEDGKEKLLPLARVPRCTSAEQRQLKGTALEAVWPGLLSADELFDLIETPSSNTHTSYESFLSFDLVQGLRAADMPRALRWVAQNCRRMGRAVEAQYYLDKLSDAIVLRAWDERDAPGVIEALAEVVLAKAEHHDDLAGVEVVRPDGTTMDAALML
ncbi:MAG: hypothetical protein M3347_00915 [Armatimonadota bacterium]|nr:hypothetical protein [Armatimonadota bacterium]